MSGGHLCEWNEQNGRAGACPRRFKYTRKDRKGKSGDGSLSYNLVGDGAHTVPQNHTQTHGDPRRGDSRIARKIS